MGSLIAFFTIAFIIGIDVITDLLVIASTKVSCAIAGKWCSIFELIHFIVNNILIDGPISDVFCGMTPRCFSHRSIRCEAHTLAKMHIGQECAGSVAACYPHGLFSAMPLQNWCLLADCLDDENGGYNKYIG